MMIYREEARKIAIRYLGEQYLGSLAFHDALPDYAHIYTNVPLEDLWFVPVPSNTYKVGGGRLVCISRKTGQIVYDGPDGGE
jgi:hypothetical protein